MAIEYLEKIVSYDRQDFADKLTDICLKLGCNPSDMTTVMNSESGMNPKARNSNGGATGLIQFMPSTALGLGTTVNELYNMSASQQLDYVYKYFYPYRGKLKSGYDIYLATFFPAAIGKPFWYILETEGLSRSVIARANPAIDLNKDSKITVGEFRRWFNKRTGQTYFSSVLNPLKLINTVWNNPTVRTKFLIYAGITTVVIGGITYYVLTNKK